MLLDPSAFVAEPDLLEALSRHAFSIECVEDRELFRQGGEPDGLYILRSGEAAMILESPLGILADETTVKPGAILGLPALVSDMPYSMTAIARAGSRIDFVTRNSFSVLMLSEPFLGLMILRVLAAEVRTTRRAISDYASTRRTRSLRRKIQSRSAARRKLT